MQLQDITEEHKLDIMRKEFVANVSHELRTLLSVSYTETLLDGRCRTEPLPSSSCVINEETDRMTRLVKIYHFCQRRRVNAGYEDINKRSYRLLC